MWIILMIDKLFFLSDWYIKHLYLPVLFPVKHTQKQTHNIYEAAFLFNESLDTIWIIIMNPWLMNTSEAYLQVSLIIH